MSTLDALRRILREWFGKGQEPETARPAVIEFDYTRKPKDG